MLKENEIRPAELRKKSCELFEQDARELLAFGDKFVEINCPACGTDNNSVYFVKNGYKFKKCQTCRSLYISPRPTVELLENYYTNSRASKFWQEKVFKVSKEARIEKIHKPRVDMVLEYVKKYNIDTDLLLEVGAGSGFFGLELNKRKIFKKIVLVEPAPIEFEQNESIVLINDVVENVKLKEKPNVVVSFELIEHIFSPYEFLKSVYELMPENSFIILTTPNIEGFELLTIGEKSSNIGGPSHLNYFNTTSINILLQKVGFKPVLVDTPGELDADIVINKHLEGGLDISNQPFLNHILIENADKHLERFQKFLQESKLSSHMLVVARK